VKTAWAGPSYLITRPSTQSWNSSAWSVRFVRTTAIFPSGLRNAVARKSSLLDVQAMRRAPGRMKREKWPNT